MSGNRQSPPKPKLPPVEEMEKKQKPARHSQNLSDATTQDMLSNVVTAIADALKQMLSSSTALSILPAAAYTLTFTGGAHSAAAAGGRLLQGRLIHGHSETGSFRNVPVHAYFKYTHILQMISTLPIAALTASSPWIIEALGTLEHLPSEKLTDFKLAAVLMGGTVITTMLNNIIGALLLGLKEFKLNKDLTLIKDILSAAFSLICRYSDANLSTFAASQLFPPLAIALYFYSRQYNTLCEKHQINKVRQIPNLRTADPKDPVRLIPSAKSSFRTKLMTNSLTAVFMALIRTAPAIILARKHATDMALALSLLSTISYMPFPLFKGATGAYARAVKHPDFQHDKRTRPVTYQRILALTFIGSACYDILIFAFRNGITQFLADDPSQAAKDGQIFTRSKLYLPMIVVLITPMALTHQNMLTTLQERYKTNLANSVLPAAAAVCIGAFTSPETLVLLVASGWITSSLAAIVTSYFGFPKSGAIREESVEMTTPEHDLEADFDDSETPKNSGRGFIGAFWDYTFGRLCPSRRPSTATDKLSQPLLPPATNAPKTYPYAESESKEPAKQDDAFDERYTGPDYAIQGRPNDDITPGSTTSTQATSTPPHTPKHE